MTKEGKDFVDSFEIAKSLVANGQKPFIALAIAFEDNHWLLAFAAIAAMVEDVKAT